MSTRVAHHRVIFASVWRQGGPAPVTGEACYNLRMRECPLCGESMRLSVRDVQEKDGTMRQVREWICPECDYFEEADGEG